MVSDAGQGDWLADALADIDNRYLRAVPTIPEPRSAVALVAAVGEGSPAAGSEAEPAPGAALLDDVETFIARFVSFPSEHALVSTTLWAAHSHLMGALDSSPRIAFLSAELGSGKTRCLEVLELLVPRPLHVANTSPAALFRAVGADDAGSCTLLHDEVDTVFGPKARDNEDLRGLLNAGHRRGATVMRCEIRAGGTPVPVQSEVFAAVALAGIGDLPDTLLSRSIVIRMRRRAGTERVEPFRRRFQAEPGHALQSQLAAFAAEHTTRISTIFPVMPEGVEDRDADVWEPLLAVADAAGGDWPHRARAAAVAHVTAGREGSARSLNVQLLADLRLIFTESGQETIPTAELLHALNALDESPWGDLFGKALESRGLARRLKTYGVKPLNVRKLDQVLKGYSRADLYDPWLRYLPAMAPVSSTGGDPSPTSATSATPLQGGQPDDAEWPTEDELPLDTDEGDPSPWAATSATPLQGGDPADIPGVDDGPALCSVCGQPLDPALAEPTHPSCSDERASR